MSTPNAIAYDRQIRDSLREWLSSKLGVDCRVLGNYSPMYYQLEEKLNLVEMNLIHFHLKTLHDTIYDEEYQQFREAVLKTFDDDGERHVDFVLQKYRSPNMQRLMNALLSTQIRLNGLGKKMVPTLFANDDAQIQSRRQARRRMLAMVNDVMYHIWIFERAYQLNAQAHHHAQAASLAQQ